MKKINLFCMVILLSGISPAQDLYGNLEGRIIDNNNIPLSQVNITLASENLQGTKGTASDDEGYFLIQALPIGKYKVEITMVGYGR